MIVIIAGLGNLPGVAVSGMGLGCLKNLLIIFLEQNLELAQYSYY
jgi:branched-subunit amino acid ABC-type transport system permease component